MSKLAVEYSVVLKEWSIFFAIRTWKYGGKHECKECIKMKRHWIYSCACE